MIPNAAIDKFHSLLMDDDVWNERLMACALQVAQYYAGPDAALTEQDYELAYELCVRVSVA